MSKFSRLKLLLDKKKDTNDYIAILVLGAKRGAHAADKTETTIKLFLVENNLTALFALETAMRTT
jgi:hypothetical protein